MPGYSANLGFLWQELALPDAIRAARRAGFAAVECHWPYEVPAQDVRSALVETGLPMLGLNTARGDIAAGDNGVCALPGREEEARAVIRQAVDYARAIGAANIHVMAGFAQGNAAEATFLANLEYASALTVDHGLTLLIEPLNHHDAPDYFLQTADHTLELIDKASLPNLAMMFDCYHMQIMHGDLTRLLARCMPRIGHIQIAAVPSRAEPDEGELDYRHIMKTIRDLGFTQPVGAEYRPRTDTGSGLGWMKTIPG